MSRQFSIPTVLRMVPNSLLKEFFEELGHGDCGLNWPELNERMIDSIIEFIGTLSQHDSNEIENVLRNIFTVSCPSGFDALLEAGTHCDKPKFGLLVPDDLPIYGKTMWTWLNHRDVFDKAQVIFQVEHMSWWRKRNDLPKNDPDISSAAISNLQTKISTLLRSQGRGKDCTVETLTRGDVDYFFAYPDDFVQSAHVHNEDGQLTPQSFRHTLLIVFAYNREDGSLELFAKLPKKLKEELEVIFARAILHWKLGPHEPQAVYEFNHLKDPSFELQTDPADGLRVEIRKMRLSAKYNGHKISVEVDDEDPQDNIHTTIRDCVNLEVTPLSEWNATSATFWFEFLPIEGRKYGTQTFDVSYPRSCTLRGARPERVELIQKYLKEWGVDCVTTAGASSVPVGD